MQWLTGAQYIKDYIIKLSFNDGLEAEVDLKDVLTGPVFQSLKDLNKFSRVDSIPELETLYWKETGADLASEFLYELALSQQKQERSAGSLQRASTC